jgi:starvation-inducible DNA-binding protein
MAGRFHIPLATDQRSVAVELQSMLVDLIDLTLIGKQAHWNVEGAHFRSVHDQLDELVDAWRELSDDVAERAVTIGASPDGQAETIAGSTELESLPAGHLSDQRALVAIADRLGEVVDRTRMRIDRVEPDDPVSGDLLVRAAAVLEKQLWMIRAQTTSAKPNGASKIDPQLYDANGVRRS